MIVVESERLRLLEFTDADAPFILRLLNEPSFIQRIVDKRVRNLDQARAYLASGPLASYAEHGFGLYRLERKEDGVTLGMAGLLQRAALDHPDLGYALLPEHWSRGYAREAAAALVDRAAQHYGWPRLLALTQPDHERSIHVLETLGFRYSRDVWLDPDQPELKLFTLDLPPRRRAPPATT